MFPLLEQPQDALDVRELDIGLLSDFGVAVAPVLQGGDLAEEFKASLQRLRARFSKPELMSSNGLLAGRVDDQRLGTVFSPSCRHASSRPWPQTEYVLRSRPSRVLRWTTVIGFFRPMLAMLETICPNVVDAPASLD